MENNGSNMNNICDLVVKVAREMPVMLTGISGIGKTTTAIKAAEVLKSVNDTVTIVDASLLSEPEDWFTKPIVTSDGIHWVPSQMITVNGPIIIDELNRVQNERVLNALLPILDFRQSVWVERLERFVSFNNRPIIATANIGWEFVGTTQLDAALLNRFAIIELPKPEFTSKYEFITRLAASVKKTGYRNIEMAEKLMDMGIDPILAAKMSFSSVCETEELDRIINYVK